MRKILCAAILILTAFSLWGCQNTSTAKEVVAEESPLVAVDNAYTDIAQVYTQDYQDGIKAEIEQMVEKAENRDLFESPLVIANPYSTVTNGIYMNFTTEEPAQISYTVTTEGYGDFSETLYNDAGDYATEHEYMLIGCVPQSDNTVCVTATKENGEVLGTYTFTYEPPALLNSEIHLQANVKEGESKAELAPGLYTILGNDTTEDDQDADYVSMHDSEGVFRAEIPIINFRSHEFVFDENGMYYSISSGAIARLDRTGYVNRIYSMGDFSLHHDYVFGSQGDLLVLASEKDATSKDDRIVSIDLESGEVTQVVDLREVFPDYFSQMTAPEGADVIDWMHINSMSIIDEDSIVISARETSTIIRLDNIYEDPTVNYMIGSDHFWAGFEGEELLLTREGEFSLQCGQHSVVYVEDDALEDGQYYLMLYNNNNTYSLQRKDYDWTADDNYYDTGIANDSKGNPSYYYKYLVDENARTFQLVESIPVAYSGFVSSVQQAGDNLVVDSGGAFTTYEFDSEGKLIQELTYGGNKWIYRVKKYTYEGYWFK